MLFCTFDTRRVSIAVIFCVTILPSLCLGGSTVTIVFRTFLISNISLLLFFGSNSIRNSGNGCLVSYLVMLFINLIGSDFC